MLHIVISNVHSVEEVPSSKNLFATPRATGTIVFKPCSKIAFSLFDFHTTARAIFQKQILILKLLFWNLFTAYPRLKGQNPSSL